MYRIQKYKDFRKLRIFIKNRTFIKRQNFIKISDFMKFRVFFNAFQKDHFYNNVYNVDFIKSH